jgi:hypothetical protein
MDRAIDIVVQGIVDNVEANAKSVDQFKQEKLKIVTPLFGLFIRCPSLSMRFAVSSLLLLRRQAGCLKYRSLVLD